MSKNNIVWLLQELKILKENSVIDEPTEEAITNYYSSELETKGSSVGKLAMVMLSAIGALLIGGGIILIFAYNWDTLSRFGRAVVAFTPTIIAVAFMFYCILKEKSRMWREAGATFMFTSAISTLALICQTYYLGGEMENFFFWVVITTLFIPFVFRSTSGFILNCAIIIAWQGCISPSWGDTLAAKGYIFTILFVMAPTIYYFLNMYKNKSKKERIVLSYLMALFIGISAPIFIASVDNDEEGIFISLFSIGMIILVLARTLSKKVNIKHQVLPFIILGSFLSFIPLMVFLSGEAWNYYDANDYSQIIFGTCSALVGAYGLYRKCTVSAIFAFFPAIVLLLLMLDLDSDLSFIIFSAITAITAIFGMIWSIKHSFLGVLNYSMITLLMAVLMIFFNGDYSMLTRAMVFIACGVGFIGLNIFMIKTNKKLAR